MSARANAVVEKQSFIGPAVSSHTSINPILITIPAATGLRNCISDVSFWSEQNNTVRLLDGGTTSYVLAVTTNNATSFNLSDDRAICGTASTAFYITFSTAQIPVLQTKQWFFSYMGFIKK